MRFQVLQGLLTRSFRVSRRQLHGAGGTRVATAIVTEAAGSAVSLAVAEPVSVGSPRSPRVPLGIFEHRGEWACVVGDCVVPDAARLSLCESERKRCCTFIYSPTHMSPTMLSALRGG